MGIHPPQWQQTGPAFLRVGTSVGASAPPGSPKSAAIQPTSQKPDQANKKEREGPPGNEQPQLSLLDALSNKVRSVMNVNRTVVNLRNGACFLALAFACSHACFCGAGGISQVGSRSWHFFGHILQARMPSFASLALWLFLGPRSSQVDGIQGC